MNAEALIGKVLGSCTLEKLIGQGGMGAVYLAQQSRPRRQVAVKVLLPMTSTANQHAAFLERFRRETDAAASLEHPNIMPVHEYGERDGLAYLVMPYISGGTLRDELEREGALPLTKVVNYLEQLAAALDAAHVRGVVHRDVKPANILTTSDRRLLLTDFGLVKIAVDGNSAQMHLTGAGVPLGTPDYMAPEQVIGGEVDARADLYSLGVILYQMITGVPPFRGEMPMQVAMQHLQMPPQSPRILRPDLPLTAEQVMLRALAKRPADRYVHAQDLASAFRLALTVSGVQLDMQTGLMPAVRPGSTENRLFVPRSRGLFDPMWQASQAQSGSSTGRPNRLNGRNDIVGKTSMTLPSLSGFLPPAAPVNDFQQQAFPTSGTAGNTPLPATQSVQSMQAAPVVPPARPRPPQKPGLLRSMVGFTGFNGFAETAPDTAEQLSSASFSSGSISAGPSTLADGGMPLIPTMPGSLEASQAANARSTFGPSRPPAPEVDQLSFSGTWLDSLALSSSPALTPSNGPAAPMQPSSSRTRQLDPLSPIPPLSAAGKPRTATGALMAPGGESNGQGTTGMMKLTQPVKVVKVPVAGQPGRYVTGFLPLIPATPENAEASSTGRLTEPASTQAIALPPTFKRAADAMHIPPEKQMQALALIVAVVVIVVGSAAFLFMRSHSNQPAAHYSKAPAATATPNLAATAALHATATAQASIILADPLRENVHNWPLFTKGPQISVFKDGAYHITDNDTQVSATALLSGEMLKDYVYTLSAQEINGDDTSLNNEFGLLMRYSTVQKNGKTYTMFYAFEVANMQSGQYQFLKYDDSADGSPWTSIWSQDFGKEFHAGHNANAKNVFRVAMKGSKFVFYMNGKQVGTTSDTSLKSGQVGMLVNLKGTEVAFSDLVLTYN